MLKHGTTVVSTMHSVVLQCVQCSDSSYPISHPPSTGKCCHCWVQSIITGRAELDQQLRQVSSCSRYVAMSRVQNFCVYILELCGWASKHTVDSTLWPCRMFGHNNQDPYQCETEYNPACNHNLALKLNLNSAWLWMNLICCCHIIILFVCLLVGCNFFKSNPKLAWVHALCCWPGTQTG